MTAQKKATALKRPKTLGDRVFKDYHNNCRRRNIFWGLSFSEFLTLTSAPCHYCGRPPSKVRSDYTYNGLDRLDNDKGYYPKNVVTCCYPCNRVKSDLLSYTEMLELGKILRTFWEKKLSLKQRA